MALLEIDALSKRFFEYPALDQVSIEVREGELLGIIGPNGSGKTTLFNCVSGVLYPNGGQVRLDGEDITHLSPQERVIKGMGFVPQTSNIFTSMTVEENLEMGAFIRRDIHSTMWTTGLSIKHAFFPVTTRFNTFGWGEKIQVRLYLCPVIGGFSLAFSLTGYALHILC